MKHKILYIYDFLKIDDSINLLPNLENLNLSGNGLSDEINLDRLLRLTILDLSNNNIESIDNLYVGNISILNLSQNRIKHLSKLSRLLGKFDKQLWYSNF